MKVFVGNLSAKTVEQDLMTAFEEFGGVDRVNIAKTTLDGQSRGFGFVDVPLDREAKAAISGLNGTSLHGHKIRVSAARRRAEER